jgi:tetratricopeptide (TPR) repeat protein
MDFVTSSSKEGDNPIRGYTRGEPYINELPIVTMATDRITLPVAGVETPLPEQATPDIPEWQRWNDYGIGLFLEGKAELKQALHAFEQVEALGRYDGPLNLARVHLREGDTAAATDAINRAAAYTDPPAPPWTLAFFSGEANRQEGRLAEAVQNFRSIVDVRTQEQHERGFDFSLDYEVLNVLGLTLYEQARQIRSADRAAERERLLREAVATYERTLNIDPENFTAHSNLADLYIELGDEALSLHHRELHERYKEDDTIRGSAHRLARERYPAANHAAEALVIYPLNRDGAPELPPESIRPSAVLNRDEVTAVFEE